MRRLSDTIERLGAMRDAMTHARPATGGDRLRDIGGFGSNPGALRARVYTPEHLSDDAALVVVLHGCTQTAADYDIGAGWSRLADEHGFVLLFPEQQRTNNPNLCFNWFSPDDIERDGGEALSIRQMVAAVIAEHAIDPARVFVTGLSAGGAMASVMLATYPEVFAGGAIVAGLAYGTAAGVPQALDRMRGHGGPDAPALGALVQRASTHRGEWPTISIWHGGADMTVHVANAEAILTQWRAVHHLPAAPSDSESIGGIVRRTWRDAAGKALIEDYRLPGIGHGTPIDTRGDDPCGTAGAYMLEAGISSTRRIAEFWGLTGEVVERKPARSAEDRATIVIPPSSTAEPRPVRVARPSGPTTPPPSPSGVGRIIDDALRAAGLVR